jgi:hypothetical protein
MTTPLVPSITDEQIAEIEAAAENIRGWTMREYFQEPDAFEVEQDWEWYVGALDEEGNQYPLLHVDAHQYDSGDSELLAKYYAMVNRDTVLALISRLRAAERGAGRYRFIRDNCDRQWDVMYDNIEVIIPGVVEDHADFDAAIDAAMQEHND